MMTRVFAILLASILLLAGSFTPEAKAANVVIICNDGASRSAPGAANFFKATGSGYDSEFIYINECDYVNNYGNSARVLTEKYGSWRVKSQGGSYGSCQEKLISDPGSLSTYYYKGYAKNGCKN